MNYRRHHHKSREGTGLTRFLKSGETANEVTLTNAPTAITQAGTPYSADWQNNIEIGICEGMANASGLTTGLTRKMQRVSGDTSYWTGIAAAPNGDVYACVRFENIYKQTGGSGEFILYYEDPRDWSGIAAAPNGDIYATVLGGDIYKQAGGTGAFVALGQTIRNWRGIAAAPNGDVYATVYVGGIYKQTGGVGDFANLGLPAANWESIAAAPNGDIYATVLGGDIYKQAGGTGAFVALGYPADGWRGIAAAPNGDIYATVYAGDMYVRKGGAGNFIALNQVYRNWYGLAAAPNGDIYGITYDTGIYKYRFENPSNVYRSQPVTTADVTIHENSNTVIRLTGALTGNRTVFLPAEYFKKTIICDCTGSYYVHVKTASGTGVYLAPGDIADVYCDGTNIILQSLYVASLAVGGDAPPVAGQLTLTTDSQSVQTIATYGNNASVSKSFFQLFRARGTRAAPLNTLAGDNLGSIHFRAYNQEAGKAGPNHDGSGFSPACIIGAQAQSDYNASSGAGAIFVQMIPYENGVESPRNVAWFTTTGIMAGQDGTKDLPALGFLNLAATGWFRTGTIWSNTEIVQSIFAIPVSAHAVGKTITRAATDGEGYYGYDTLVAGETRTHIFSFVRNENDLYISGYNRVCISGGANTGPGGTVGLTITSSGALFANYAAATKITDTTGHKALYINTTTGEIVAY